MRRSLVLATFFVSGATALMYELAWTRSFQLVLGSTIYSTSAVFASVLLGFALGAYAASDLADRTPKPLRTAMFIEWGVAAYAIFLELLRQLAARHLDLVPSSQLLRVIVSIALVLPPAVLFGSLWPLLMRYWISDERRLGFGSGTLYAVNSVGSGLGAFAAGYFLIPLLGISRTCWLAAGLNALVGVVLFALQRDSGGAGQPVAQRSRAAAAQPAEWSGAAARVEPQGKPLILAAFFCSGMAAMIYELTWIRPITTIFSSTIYSVSIILASFMLGLAVGSGLIRRFADRVARPLVVYAAVEGAIGLYCVLLLGLFGLLNVVSIEALGTVHNLFGHHVIQFLSVFLLLLVPTSLMGATFPLLALAYVDTRVGKGIGELYAINNAGAILGTLAAGFWLIPELGIRLSTLGAAALNFGVALAVLAFSFPALRKYSPVAAAALGCLLYTGPEYSIKQLYSASAFGFFAGQEPGVAPSRILFYEEGRYGSVFVARVLGQRGMLRLFVNGRGSSSLRLHDVRVSTLLGYLPVLLKPEASRAMVIGFGTGATSHILTDHFETTTVEIEPTILKAAAHFSVLNGDVWSHPKHKLVYDDARGHLVTTDERYDIIVNHPLDPFQSFSSLLFTREFFEVVRSRLTAGGLYVQWLPTYHLSPGELRDFYRTLREVFSHCAVFLTVKRGEHIDYRLPVEGIQFSREISEHGKEVIWVCSQQEFPVDGNLFSESFGALDPYHKSFLGWTALYSGRKIHDLLLFTDRELEGYEIGASALTDDRPRLEFTTPFRWIGKGGRSREGEALGDLIRYGSSRRSGIRP
jgi:spermidine synthase